MLTERGLHEALKAFLNGREALALIKYDDGSKEVLELQELFPEGCHIHYLVDVPAADNHEFDRMFEIADKNLVSGEPEDTVSEAAPLPETKKNNGVSEADKNRIRELHKSGKSITEIAKETGIKYNAVWNQVKNRIVAAPITEGSNADREKCKTCRYRGKGNNNGCDYAVIVKHSRGCSVEDCTVYEQGKRPDAKKPLDLQGKGKKEK